MTSVWTFHRRGPQGRMARSRCQPFGCVRLLPLVRACLAFIARRVSCPGTTSWCFKGRSAGCIPLRTGFWNPTLWHHPHSSPGGRRLFRQKTTNQTVEWAEEAGEGDNYKMGKGDKWQHPARCWMPPAWRIRPGTSRQRVYMCGYKIY